MILRHVTLKKNLYAIYEDGCLDSSKTFRKQSSDREYVYFELNPSSDVLVNLFPVLKSNMINEVYDGDQFELLFDGYKMMEDGIEVVKASESEINQNKFQLIQYQKSGYMSEDEYDSIGEFVVVKGKVSLKYLTNNSKEKLESFLAESKL